MNVCQGFNKCSTLVSVLSQMNTLVNLRRSFKMRFNIIHSLSPRSFNGLFPIDFGINILY
jgi:hypothetical protein